MQKTELDDAREELREWRMGRRPVQRPAWPGVDGLVTLGNATSSTRTGKRTARAVTRPGKTAFKGSESGKRSGRVHKKELLVSDARDDEEVRAEARALYRRDLWEQPVRESRVIDTQGNTGSRASIHDAKHPVKP